MKRTILAIALLSAALCVPAPMPSHAAPLGISAGAAQKDFSIVQPVLRRGGGFARRTTVVGRGGGFARRTTVVGRGGWRGGAAVRRTTVVRPGWRGGGVRWARPGGYWWPAGGAIAAGAAIGVVGAATAAAWAGAPPAPNMCWYYTDPSRTKGFWDACR